MTGLKYIWADDALRMVILIIGGLNSLLTGPLFVGVPVLADQRLPEGAMAFGLLISAYAGGSLIGSLMAGFLPRPSENIMRFSFISLMVAFGTVMGALSSIQSTWLDFALLLLIGTGNGYISLILFTWIQARTPKEILGRMMSILMFASYGLVPVSQAISGAVIKWNLDVLFILAGTLVMLLSLWTVFQPALSIFIEGLVMHEE